MANHELPEWEAPSADSTARSSFWRRLVNNRNPFLTTPKPSIDHKHSPVGTTSPARTQNFDKESGLPTPANAAAEGDLMIKTRGEQRRICGIRRRTFLLLVLAAVLVLALIIGLAVGLSRHKYVTFNMFINNTPI